MLAAELGMPWQVEEYEGIGADHHYRAQAQTDGAPQQARVRRCVREFCSLTTDLPCEAASSIFVRADARNLCLWKALIVGAPPAGALSPASCCGRLLHACGAHPPSWRCRLAQPSQYHGCMADACCGGPDALCRAQLHGRLCLQLPERLPSCWQVWLCCSWLACTAGSMHAPPKSCTLHPEPCAPCAGPEDTPYHGGCWIFDIYFPTTYPGRPMLVNLATTGAGCAPRAGQIGRCTACRQLAGLCVVQLPASQGLLVATDSSSLCSVQQRLPGCNPAV